MRVLVLAPPMAVSGGIQRYTTTLVRALLEILQDEHVRCLAISEDSLRNGHRGLSAQAKLSFIRQAFGEALGWQPDLIICAHLALGPVGWALASLRRRPFWTVVHGIEAWVALPFLKHAALRRADRVIVTSRYGCEQVINRQRINPGRIAMLPCALDDTLTTIAPASTGPHNSVPDQRRVILTVGRMEASERYKGHEIVLQVLPSVLSRVPDATYIVVGEGNDRVRLEALAHDLGLSSSVTFTGRVSDVELVALYKRCDVFVLPARTSLAQHEAKGEGFGIVFLEAMAFGKPVIGPIDGAPKEIIQHGRHGLLVNPEDPSAVAEAIVDLLTNTDKACSMGQEASAWVRQHYSYGNFRENLRHLLDDADQIR